MQRTKARLPRLSRRGFPLVVLALLVLSGLLTGLRQQQTQRTVSTEPVAAVASTQTQTAARRLALAPVPRIHVAAVTPTAAGQVQLKSGRKYLLLAHHGDPAPLVVALHGYLNTPTDLDKASGLSALARSQGFTLVYGEGVRLSWNSGFACCGIAAKQGIDDIAYLSAVIADASTRADVDPTRIFLIGFSDGGMLAERAACALPEVAAAVSVAGPLLVPCRRQVTLMHIHGRGDRTVPLDGGFSTLTQTTFPNSTREGARLPLGSTWRLVVWPGGHSWPTSTESKTAQNKAHTSTTKPSIDATSLSWAFFQKHPLKSPTHASLRFA